MALSAFEALQEIRKKSDTSTPSGSKPTEVPLASSGRKSAFDALQEIRSTKAPEKIPAPSKAVTPAVPLVAKPKSSSEVMGEMTLPTSAPTASDASLNLVGGLIMETARKIRDTAPTRPERRLASVGLNFLETVKDLAVTKPEAVLQAESPRRAVLPLIDYGVNMATLGGVDFFMGAAPAVVGAVAQPIAKIWDPTGNAGETSDKVEQAVQWGMDKLFRDVIGEGIGGATIKAVEAVGLDLNEAEEVALKSALTVGIVMVGFKAKEAVGGKLKPSIAKSSDLVFPMADTLGIELKPDGKGGWLMPDEATILKAHKDTLMRQASEATPYTKAKMDAADVAREMLTDYRNLSSGAFEAKWREPVAQGTKLAEQMETTVKEKVAEAEVVKDAEIINEVLNTPATRASRRRVDDLSEAGQFAFEQELVEMAGKNDPKLEKKASEAGHSYERKATPDKLDDKRPGFYDAETGKIVLHENVIRETLDRVWEKGDVLKLGGGKTTTVFRKMEGETFEALKNRYESVLIDHEIAHAKTITPEDVARIKAAKAAGDKAALDKIRTEMEDKANKYTFERGNDLDSKTNAEIDRAVERINEGLRVRESINELKFDDANKEADYRAFRAETRKGKTPDGPDEFKVRLQSERRILDRYKVAREAQKKVAPEAKQSVAVKRAVTAELRSLKKADKLERVVSSKNTKILRERISRRLEKQVLRQKSKEAQEKIRNVGKDKAAAQQALVDYMRSSGVPMEVRGRFMTQLKNAKTQGDATRIIAEVSRDWNKYKRQETASKIKKTLKTALKGVKKGEVRGRLTAENRAELKKIQMYAKMDRNTVNKKIIELEGKARAKMAEEAQKNGTEPGLYLPDDVARQIELLELGGVKEQSLQQLEHTLAVIKEIATEGKTKRAEYLAREKDYTERFIATASKELTGSETRQKQAGSFVTSADTVALQVSNPWRVFADLTSDLGGVFQTEGSRLTRGVNKADGATKQASFDMEALQKELRGDNWQEDLAVRTTVVHNLGSLPDANGNPVDLRMTRAEAQSYFMIMREDGGLETLTNPKGGTAFTSEILDRITSILRPEDIASADKLQKELYPARLAELKGEFEQREGRPLGEVGMYAGPRKYERGQTVGGETIFDIGRSFEDSARAARLSKTPGYTEIRTKALGQVRPSKNPELDYLIYSQRAAHYIEVGQKVQRWKALLADSGVQRSIIESRGESFLATLQSNIDKFERGGQSLELADSSAKALDAAMSNVASALLMSPKVWSGQFSSIAGVRAYASTLPGKTSDFWKGVRSKEVMNEMLENSVVVRTRGLATIAQTRQKFEGRTGIRGKIDRGIDRIKEVGGKPLEGADKITTRRSAAGIYLMQKNHYLRQGFSEAKAREFAGLDVDNAIDRTQSSTGPTGRSQAETGKLGLLAPLSQQPKKIANGNIEAYRLLKQGRITGKQYADFFLWNNVVQGGMYVALRLPVTFALKQAYGAVYEALGEYELADKEKEDAAGLFSPKSIATELTLGSVMNVTSFPIIGGVVNTAIQNAANDRNFEFRPTLAQTVFEDFQTGLKKLGDGNYGGSSLSSARAVSRLVGLGDPTGLMQVFLKAQNEAHKRAKKEEKQTPAGKQAAEAKAEVLRLEREAKAKRIKAMKRN